MKAITLVIVLFSTGAAAAVPLKEGVSITSTPAEMVASYEGLADVILGAKKTERSLVRSILATTYAHAQMVAERAEAGIKDGEDVTARLETLATLVSQLGNEGDTAVAAVRKRLLEGGHHHHAAREGKDIFDKGFVIVTRAARKSFLDSANKIGRMTGAPAAARLAREWRKVADEYNKLMASTK